ncbi:hypothetical protein L249_6157 [Ophiocordyceps polyrhachis-furcata BCC 54312]|uniref:Rhodopsin domain-containing protein n=1 Tax=Ophiocordyceps polyrhachis-furcata BCC 54312 TaxID=1330021 RepID=A0A367LIR4_9HYPO|nr:hypothetical protein L249_6157 [Ophiocordyceps polyrhachis-furcata BCC 54312]
MNPSTTPALMPPPGVVPGPLNQRSGQPLLVATATACLSLTTVCTAIRLYTKHVLLKQLNVEDCRQLVIQLGFASFSGVLFSSGDTGHGQHQWNVSVANARRVALLANISEILYAPTMFAAKAAVLLSLKRIFTGARRNYVHWAFVSLIALNGLFYLSILLALVCACVPRAKIDNPTLAGSCVSTHGLMLATSAANILSDLSILFLPLVVVWSLQTPLKRKMTAGAVFATGFFGCVSSILRLYYSILLMLTDDFTWALYPVGVWAVAEIATVILACCFPVFPRFFHHLRHGEASKVTLGRSYRESSCGDGQLRHGVYTPWLSASAERVMEKDVLNERSTSEGAAAGNTGRAAMESE